MRTNTNFLLLSLAVLLTFSACKPEEDDPVAPAPPPTNEEEVITTLTLTFTDPENAGNVRVMRFSDPDGVGGTAPTITSDAIPGGRAYNVAIAVLNESVSPATNITAEILAEDEDHQFFFEVTGGAALTMSYNDQDSNGKPIGLSTTAIVGAASTGTLKVTLRHQPDKGAANVAAGDITNAGGDTDIEVVFPVTIPPTNAEIITTLTLTFTDPDNAGNVRVLRFSDLDGDGGAAPTITSDAIPGGRAYNVAIAVLNESVSPATNITAEILAEDEDHQFFFEVTGGAALTMSYNDQDSNGDPIGLSTTAVVGAAGTGTLKVTLRYQPDKGAANVAAGDITNAGGDTDIEVVFPVTIE